MIAAEGAVPFGRSIVILDPQRHVDSSIAMIDK